MAYLSDIIGESYKEWENGFIFLDASTGCGKTTFIKQTLSDYAQETHQNILYLVNRTLLKEQLSSDLEKNSLDIFEKQYEPFNTTEKADNIDTLDDWSIFCNLGEKYERMITEEGEFPFKNITIMSYQKLERNLLNGNAPKNYQYIVCDEAHYFHSDATFANTSFISYKYIMKIGFEKKAKVILMSASAWILKEYLASKGELRQQYRINPSYPHVKNFYVYDKKDKISLINKILEQDETTRILYFTNSKRTFKDILSAFTDKCCFMASKNSETYKAFIDTYTLAELLSLDSDTITFNLDKRICVSTSKMDNGVNIKDRSLNYIFCDFDEPSSLVQALGRKRALPDNDWCNIFIENHQQIADIIKIQQQCDVERMLLNEQYDELNQFMIANEYIGNPNFFVDFPALYLSPLDFTLKLKETVIMQHQTAVSNNDFIQEYGYLAFLSKYLCLPTTAFITHFRSEDNIPALISLLESIPNGIVYRASINELINQMHELCPSLKAKQYNKINEYFLSHNVPFTISSEQCSSHTGEKNWILTPIVQE